MTWAELSTSLAGLGEQPPLVLLAFVCGLLVGMLAGLYARWRSAESSLGVRDSGDTHADMWHQDSSTPLSGMTWLDPSPHRMHTFELSQPPAAPPHRARTRVRAGSHATELRPSYDSRKAAPKA